MAQPYSSQTSPVPSQNGSRPAVFNARNLAKVYRMGDVEVHALRGVDLDLFQSEFVVILGRQAAESRRS